MRETQGRDRRKGVQNVSHGAQADHKQAKVRLRLQALIFSQGGKGLSWENSTCQPIHSGSFILNLDVQAGGVERQ